MRTSPKKVKSLLLKWVRLRSRRKEVLGLTQATDSSIPKLTKEVLFEKDDEKHVGAVRTPEKLEEVGPSDALRKQQPENLPLAYCSLYVIQLTKLDNELSQDELVISEYVFGKDVDDRQPSFDGCNNKEAARVSMAILNPGEEVEMSVINIWPNILNNRERKWDLATPSKLFMSYDQSVSASQSTYCSIIIALMIITKILSY
ncbi:LOW QUALITY PROTEIN: hypothetical protein Cgig2_023139 [Carnegiea gigantea]|uniref:Uncharacterized protein n=1 Tax=Carnegiea gigantea TaxID=171969 RepID=A0A9Q1GJ81_9CARY|nr:LOW QUALITY PROTEIN: hypothetical protein Cgig2_023139 [Carnegiea gigantea]